MSLRTDRSSAVPAMAALLPAALCILLAVAGCNKSGAAGAAGTAGGAGAPGGDAAQIAAGKAVFASNNCTRCHAMDAGQGGQGGRRRAPDLTHVGAEPQHTAQWLAAYVKDPKSVDPRSRMPAFGGRISDADLASLGAYLASLK